MKLPIPPDAREFTSQRRPLKGEWGVVELRSLAPVPLEEAEAKPILTNHQNISGVPGPKPRLRIPRVVLGGVGAMLLLALCAFGWFKTRQPLPDRYVIITPEEIHAGMPVDEDEAEHPNIQTVASNGETTFKYIGPDKNRKWAKKHQSIPFTFALGRQAQTYLKDNPREPLVDSEPFTLRVEGGNLRGFEKYHYDPIKDVGQVKVIIDATSESGKIYFQDFRLNFGLHSYSPATTQFAAFRKAMAMEPVLTFTISKPAPVKPVVADVRGPQRSEVRKPMRKPPVRRGPRQPIVAKVVEKPVSRKCAKCKCCSDKCPDSCGRNCKGKCKPRKRFNNRDE